MIVRGDPTVIMHKPSAPVTRNIAPPSYSEATGQSMSTTNAPVRTQCEYPDRNPSQPFNYPPPGMAYPYPSNSYSGMPYNPSYISTNQPCTPYVISATVVAAEDNSVSERNRKRRGFWMCVVIIWFVVLVSILTIIFR